MKRLAILQSNYIPWKGYFDMIALSDEFMILDNVQYTKNDWRNRNQIMTKQGKLWLTIPPVTKGKFGQNIEDVEVVDQKWTKKHWNSIEQAYSKRPGFAVYRDQFRSLYLQAAELSKLSDINFLFLTEICKMLGIKTPITSSHDYDITFQDKQERVIELCKAAHATHYLSGPAGQNYIDEKTFEKIGVTLEYADYSRYPEYPQVGGEFQHGVSVLDLMFNMGEDASKYMYFDMVSSERQSG